MVLDESRGDSRRALMLAEQLKTTPTVFATLEAIHVLQAAVGAGTTTDSTWAAPLAAYGIAKELLSLVRNRSILGALENRFRRVPFRTNIARETATGTGGAWIAERNSTPVAAPRHAEPGTLQAGKIVALSDELRRMATLMPSAASVKRWRMALRPFSTRNSSRTPSPSQRVCGRRRSQVARRQ